MKMDRELASAVLGRWNDGDPVAEVALYKAASVLGVNPQDALTEARFLSYFDSYLLEKRAMSGAERLVFSAGAGFSAGSMTKTASAHGLSPDELIVEALRERNFIPDLSKLAMMAAPPQDPMMQDPAMQGMPPGDPAAVQQAAGAAMMQPPQEGAVLQQQPGARVRPTPTAPEQIAPSDMGNMEELLGQSQQMFGDQAMENGGVPPTGQPQPQPEPPDYLTRVMQVGPNLDQETAQRYAEQLERFETGFGMQITDPKQMVKFVQELQKVDGKKVDQGIKAMSKQLEQEQAQELGIDGGAPTIDGGGGPQVMAPKQNAQQPQASVGPQEQAPQPGGVEGPEGPAQGMAANKPPGKAPPPQAKGPQEAAQQAAVEKVAHVARILARSSYVR